MGTTWSVRAVASPAQASEITAAVETCLETVIAQMSPWRAYSDISRFNSAPAGSMTVLPAAFATVLACALAVAEASDGAFDPTLGALVDLWGFGAAKPVVWPPAAGDLTMARDAAGWRSLRYEDGVLLQPGRLHLDFSGIAKGYAVDLVAEYLSAMGFDSLLVEIGGELRGVGVKPDGHPWWIDIESPPASPLDPSRFALFGAGLATSGDYRRVMIHDGRRFSHTLDPRTGYPVTHGLASVTVLADTAMWADAQATAITVLGPDAGYDYAARNDLAALLIDRDGDRWREQMTPALSAMLN